MLHALPTRCDRRRKKLIHKLSANYDLALLSGDNEKEREQFLGLFGKAGHLHFNQSPLHKLNFVRQLQTPGKTVMMVGDGLNDAGALKQSDVGVAVVESIGAFSPASDVIMAANMVPRLHEILRFAKSSVRVVRLSLLISSALQRRRHQHRGARTVVPGHLRHPDAAEFRDGGGLCLRPYDAAGTAHRLCTPTPGGEINP